MLYIKQGAIVFIDAEPHAGSEYGGHSATTGNIRRPVIVISGNDFNRVSGSFVMVFPITSKNKSLNPLAFPILTNKQEGGIKGYIMATQILGYDFEARSGEVVGQIDAATTRKLARIAQAMFK
ncbi:type II toxin-antitoxin system PemK/MazF family toxin [Leuconostoc citreum]|uniref:type II toxin-antitoxin system PemK/MazF family toxin n=1 Tax=Leuconostoc citreum TaxID=33964 RepID=UPI00200B8B32|nr:type II toxin-antitoxin system PemK/MazF family toxin [Leuconostoc citreum]MCK8606439.1 type II toxin-antitoxin system PemK/MazF family toxin [Leuconostoc citreum]